MGIPMPLPFQGDDPTNFGEIQALQSILAWSSALPDWQRDALRRLCAGGDLTDADTDELLAICRGDAEANPLAADHIRSEASASSEVVLCQMQGVQHVNALATGERLTFARSGLTVVYGDNGAGKSGYARILKKACRARNPQRDADILPNVFRPTSGTPTATIDFMVGGQRRSAAWSQGSAPDPRLSSISVFDSRTASVHVDSENEVAYVPEPLRILQCLASAAQTLKGKLDAEIGALEAQTPAIIRTPSCGARTAVGSLIRALSHDTDRGRVESLASLATEEVERLRRLETDLAGDPAHMSRLILGSVSKLDNLLNHVAALTSSLGGESARHLGTLKGELSAAEEAARVTSDRLFAASPLPAISSSAWRTLWEAARDYSTQKAYPEHSFPVTGEGFRCVLCQQELGDEASRRLESFEAFVQDETRRQEDAARRAYTAHRTTLQRAVLPFSEIREFLTTIADQPGQNELVDEVRRALIVGRWRIRQILRSDGESVGSAPEFPVDAVTTLKDALRQRASAITAEAQSPERMALVTERDELKDRLWLGAVRDEVLAHIARLGIIEASRRCTRDTDTRRITTKSGELAGRLVTERLQRTFSAEIGRLTGTPLAVELQHVQNRAGTPRFAIRLSGETTHRAGQVLSEGEHRCVALAAFLAELATAGSKSAIVFDDPVSSLDHGNRDKVAARLAEEARHRQVIVFTHDVAMVLLLIECCSEAPPVPIQHRCISRGPQAAGFCGEVPPAAAVDVENGLAGMRAHLGNVRICHDRGNQARWAGEVDQFYKQLRTCWERAVEEVLSPVLRRLSRNVSTGGLVELTILTEADCTEMREAYGRCSVGLHSQPVELNPSLPTPEAIMDEIDLVERWIRDIRRRQEGMR